MALDAAPRSVDVAKLRAYLCGQPGVEDVHDLRLVDETASSAMTAHLVMPEVCDNDALLQKLCREIDKKFGIDHATFQIEQQPPNATRIITELTSSHGRPRPAQRTATLIAFNRAWVARSSRAMTAWATTPATPGGRRHARRPQRVEPRAPDQGRAAGGQDHAAPVRVARPWPGSSRAGRSGRPPPAPCRPGGSDARAVAEPVPGAGDEETRSGSTARTCTASRRWRPARPPPARQPTTVAISIGPGRGLSWQGSSSEKFARSSGGARSNHLALDLRRRGVDPADGEHRQQQELRPARGPGREKKRRRRGCSSRGGGGGAGGGGGGPRLAQAIAVPAPAIDISTAGRGPHAGRPAERQGQGPRRGRPAPSPSGTPARPS